MERGPFELPGLNCNMVAGQWQCSKELKLWTDELGMRYKSQLLTKMLPLQKVHVNPAILQAAMPYWDRLKGEFRFGDICLCPTLEEIRRILGLTAFSFSNKIAVPLPEESYAKYIAEFLELRGPEPYIKPYEAKDLKLSYAYMYQVVRKKLPPFSQKVNEKELMIHQRRYITCFFGEVLFGKVDDSMNLMVVKTVDLFIQHYSIVPVVLGELIRNLNKGESFGGSAIILFIWLCEHMPLPLSRPIDLGDLWRDYYEKEKYIRGKAQVLYDSWGHMKPLDFNWRMEGGKVKFVVGHKGPDGRFQTDLVELPTFREVVGYRPLRFVRQFGYVQDCPYSRKSDIGVKVIVPYKTDIVKKFQNRWNALFYGDQMSEPYALKRSPVPQTTPEYDSWLTE